LHRFPKNNLEKIIFTSQTDQQYQTLKFIVTMSVAMSASSSQQSNYSSSSTSHHGSQHSYNYSASSQSTAQSSHFAYSTTQAAEWTQPFEVEDEDIMFDGEPLSALFEKEHGRLQSAMGLTASRPRKEESRGRKKRRDAH
jgi:hypothetical protein